MIKPIAEMITDGLQMFYTQFKAQRILKTKEEVAANTNPDNLVSAVVVGELNNDLNGYSFGETADGEPGYRKPGADTVTPFNRGNWDLTFALNGRAVSNMPECSCSSTVTIQCRNGVIKSISGASAEKGSGTTYLWATASNFSLKRID